MLCCRHRASPGYTENETYYRRLENSPKKVRALIG